MAYVISSECISCGACESTCPVEAISQGDDQFVIDANTCTDCGAVSCLPEVTLKVKQARGVPKSLSKQQVEIQLRGICDHCA